MKVLQINSVCGVGSTGRIATDLYKVLEEQGQECVIAYGRGNSPDGIKSIKIGTNFDNYMHVMKTRLFDKHGFGSMKATKEFIEVAKEFNPDVIHLHNIHGYYINIELLFNFLKETNKPIVWTLHDCWAFTGHCSHFDYIGCNRWKTGCYKCPQKMSYPSSKLKDNSKDNYNRKKALFTGIKKMTIITPSKWLCSLVRESFLKEYPVKVINNGIDLSVFKSTESDFRKKNNLKDSFIILGVANVWGERKGLKYFLDLSNRLKADEILVLVGVTEKQKNSLPPNIIGISKTNNLKELVEIYSAANVFLNLTLEDNFPTTNLESLACGTPVITFNTGGSIECVDKNCGYFVNKGNISELLDTLKEVRQNGKVFYSLHCEERAKRLYDKNIIFNNYIDNYKKLADTYKRG